MGDKNANIFNGSIAIYLGVVMLIVTLCSLFALALSLHAGATGAIDHAWEFILLFTAVAIVSGSSRIRLSGLARKNLKSKSSALPF